MSILSEKTADFIENNFYFTNPSNFSKSRKLNKEQLQILDAVSNNKKVILFKERQIGASTFALFYCVYQALKNNNHKCIYVSHSQVMARTWLSRIQTYDIVKNNTSHSFADVLTFKNGSRIYFTNIESTMIQNNPCNLVILDECSYTGDIQTVVDFLQQNEHTSTEIIFFNSYLNNGLASTLENTHNEIIFTNIFNFKCTHKMLPVYMSLKDELFKESNYSFDYICR